MLYIYVQSNCGIQKSLGLVLWLLANSQDKPRGSIHYQGRAGSSASARKQGIEALTKATVRFVQEMSQDSVPCHRIPSIQYMTAML